MDAAPTSSRASSSASSAKKTSGKKPTKKKAMKKKATKKKATAKKATKKKATAKTTTKKKATAKTTTKKASKKKTASRSGGGKRDASIPSAAGKHLVIVESPAKARTINRYLGEEFVVCASKGHIRDLPKRAARKAKGAKAKKDGPKPIPGVDIDRDFAVEYEVLSDKKQHVAEIRRAAKGAEQIWFATDLDREGEAIAWHLAEELGVDPGQARRVVFNAITQAEIRRAFDKPRGIDLNKVNAQQARRVLDRLVGYQASPLLWRKVAANLSAGRVQSVAVRLIVERERAIEAFVPDEHWKVTVRVALKPAQAQSLADAWGGFMTAPPGVKPPTVKAQHAWMAERGVVRCELVELGGEKFSLGCQADDPQDLSAGAIDAATRAGLVGAHVEVTEDASGKGPARFKKRVTGSLDPAARYEVASVEQKQTSSRPPAPFITSSLQIAASNRLGFGAERTMRLAQELYEGVEVSGEGRVALITYMRTDSTHLSPDAIGKVRDYISTALGDAYLPAKAKVYASSNKDAQEAHEAIRPTDPARSPNALRGKFRGPRADDLMKLYDLIWSRFVGCQMTPARWNGVGIRFRRTDKDTGAVLRATGRTLAFDGFYRVMGVPTASDEQTLPDFQDGDEVAPMTVEPEQKFSAPPPRFNEASLVKALESEGIGRPSTYASIIATIQRRNYVEQLERKFHPTDLGEVVTDKLVEAFPRLLDVGYTRDMESELDHVEEGATDWREMLAQFWGPFAKQVETAMEGMSHAKAEIQDAIYACPECNARTAYRFGKNGRFLSCTAYPECKYAAPIDRQGRPLLPERVDIVCPIDGSEMVLRSGRFGPFMASVNYPEISFAINVDKKGCVKLPTPPAFDTDEACPKCESPLKLRRGERGPYFYCSQFPKCRAKKSWATLEEGRKLELDAALAKHERANPAAILRRKDGTLIEKGTLARDLIIEGGLATLEVHPEAEREGREAGGAA